MELTIILFVILVGFSAFFSMVEIAYFSISAGKVRSMVRKKLRYARRVERLKRDPEKLLITILVGNNLVNVSAAAIATSIAVDLFGSTGVGIASGVVTFVVLVFGEIVPKSFGQTYAETITRFSAPALLFIVSVLTPVSALFEWLVRSLHRIFSGERKKKSLVSEEEIRSMMHLGVEEGSVEHHESKFVERLFRFNDMPVSTVMVPREKVIMLNGDIAIKHAMHPAADSGYSRFPVYEDDEDRIVGLVHIKDIVRADNSGDGEQELKEISHPLNRVASGDHLDDVLRKMQKERTHMYLVEGEGGKIAGIVTMEDILEELLGEIYDESDAKKITGVQ
jgi:Mg2+/Co2+ transporter CorB